MDSIADLKNTVQVNPKDYPTLAKLQDLIHINQKPLDYVIALGHNWDRKAGWPAEDWEAQASIPTKVTALASYLLVLFGLTDKVIFSGGKTAGENQPGEAEAMYQYLLDSLVKNSTSDEQAAALNLLNKSVILEETSYDTHTNAIETKGLIPETATTGLMSVGYHLELRARSTFKHSGFNPTIGISSDSVLEEILTFGGNNLEEIKKINPLIAEQFVLIRKALRELAYDFVKYKSWSGLFSKNEQGKLEKRPHGPEYHLAARIYQFITRDPSGRKLTEKAKKKRLEEGK